MRIVLGTDHTHTDYVIVLDRLQQTVILIPGVTGHSILSNTNDFIVSVGVKVIINARV